MALTVKSRRCRSSIRDVPRGTCPAPQHVEHLLGVGGGGDVEIARHARSVRAGREQRVPDRTADEMDLVAGLGEAPAQLGEHGGEVHEFPHRRLDGRRNRLDGGTTRGRKGHDEPA
jgi:hypothetical protein